MPKRLSTRAKRRTSDPNQAAFRLVQRTEADSEDVRAEPKRQATVVRLSDKRKDPAAVALGRKGGLKSATARMEKIKPEERRRIASNAARARWAKERGDG